MFTVRALEKNSLENTQDLIYIRCWNRLHDPNTKSWLTELNVCVEKCYIPTATFPTQTALFMGPDDHTQPLHWQSWMHSRHANTHPTTICPARYQRNTLSFMDLSYVKSLNTELSNFLTSDWHLICCLRCLVFKHFNIWWDIYTSGTCRCKVIVFGQNILLAAVTTKPDSLTLTCTFAAWTHSSIFEDKYLKTVQFCHRNSSMTMNTVSQQEELSLHASSLRTAAPVQELWFSPWLCSCPAACASFGEEELLSSESHSQCAGGYGGLNALILNCHSPQNPMQHRVHYDLLVNPLHSRWQQGVWLPVSSYTGTVTGCYRWHCAGRATCPHKKPKSSCWNDCCSIRQTNGWQVRV